MGSCAVASRQEGGRFEPCGAVFIMNSKIHLRKNSLNEYFKAISPYFRVYSLLGFIKATR